ncbi:ABC transporter permease [Bacillus sp. Bva_UNVM-123]|uniref:ABC transporter permease n=1 Tax=Bacillus sp. Bva_UNVM-123 TaxID=2829798 RepID=UPI00391F9323
MKKLISAEFIKVQWWLIIFLILLDLVVNVLLGISDFNMLTEYYEPTWSNFFMYTLNFHAMFFYPLFSGIIAALICSYEHRSGGWKQVLSLPYTRTSIYLSKYIMLLLILAFIHILFFVVTIASGYIVQVEGTIDWFFVLKSLLLGWISVFPLTAIQLWFSTTFKSFGIAFSLNIIFVLPNIIFSGIHSLIGMWNPFILPFYAMIPQGAPFSPRIENVSLSIFILLSSILFVVIGIKYFKKREFI